MKISVRAGYLGLERHRAATKYRQKNAPSTKNATGMLLMMATCDVLVKSARVNTTPAGVKTA